MRYKTVVPAEFRSRPNRFEAVVWIDGAEETVHVKNTGRCRELLVPGARVYLAKAENPARKTKYDLIAVEKERPGKDVLLINMDSQAPNDIAEEWLRRGLLFSQEARLRRETVHGASRFDFYIEDGERRAFLEVKGVTLERDGIAAFPDAPTERGVKHIRELIGALAEGYEAYLLFIVQMKGCTEVVPNDLTQPAFGAALREAKEQSVRLLAVDCTVTPDTVTADNLLPVVLGDENGDYQGLS